MSGISGSLLEDCTHVRMFMLKVSMPNCPLVSLSEWTGEMGLICWALKLLFRNLTRRWKFCVACFITFDDSRGSNLQYSRSAKCPRLPVFIFLYVFCSYNCKMRTLNMQYTYALTFYSFYFVHFGCRWSLISTKVSSLRWAVVIILLKSQTHLYETVTSEKLGFFRSQLSLKQVPLLRHTKAFRLQPVILLVRQTVVGKTPRGSPEVKLKAP